MSEILLQISSTCSFDLTLGGSGERMVCGLLSSVHPCLRTIFKCQADTSQGIVQLYLIFDLSFPVSVHLLSHFTAFSLKSTYRLSYKRPFIDIPFLVYIFYTLSLSRATANLFYLSTGTSETIGFSLFLSKPVLQMHLGSPSWEKR